MRKKLNELALNLTERLYREYKATSYSLISRYLSNGPIVLVSPAMEETERMELGSIVDTLLTKKYLFDDTYFIVNMPKTSDKVIQAADMLISLYGSNKEIWEVSAIQQILTEVEYYSNYKPDTKLVKFSLESCDYVDAFDKAAGRIIISTDTYNTASNIVNAILNAPFKDVYLLEDSGDIEVYNQIQFSTKFGELEVKCMFDRIIVNHSNKTITPIDFKITGENELNFVKSVYKYKYYIQAELYRYILSNILDEDNYYSDFTVLPFTFIVCNDVFLCPIAWQYPIESTHMDWMEAIKDIDTNFKTKQFKYFPRVLDNSGIMQLDIK